MKFPSGRFPVEAEGERARQSQTAAVSAVRAALADLKSHYGSEAVAAYVASDQATYLRWVEVGQGMPRRWQEGDSPGIPVEGGLVAFSAETDIDGARPASLGLIEALIYTRQLERELQRYRFQSSLDDVRLQSLYDVGLAIASTLDQEQLVDEILMRAVALLDARRGALFLYEDGALRLSGAVGGDAAAGLDVKPDDLGRLMEEFAAADLLPGAEHALAHPIEADVRRLGVLVVGDKESRSGVGPFSDADSPTLGLFASQAAIALENARLHREALAKERLEHEMQLASEIQERLLPRSLPELEGYAFAAWSRSARHVGGDYHDLLPLAEDRVGLVLGDVSGKGVPASLLVSTVHSALRLLLEQCGVGEDLLRRLNDHVAAASTSNKFITFFIAEVNRSGGLLYGNAGHNSALLVAADGSVRELSSGGMPLGMIAGAPYRTAETRMERGDLLCIYSDGITEAENRHGDEFDLPRLREVLLGARNESPDMVVERVREAVESFAGGLPQGDDQTLVIARRG